MPQSKTSGRLCQSEYPVALPGLSLSDSGKAHPASGQFRQILRYAHQLELELFLDLSDNDVVARELACGCLKRE